MKTDIISQIAQIVRQNQVKPNSGSKNKTTSVKSSMDVVEISSKSLQQSQSTEGMEKEQKMKVERIKSLVQESRYQMDEKVVESIAGNIAKIFVP